MTITPAAKRLCLEPIPVSLERLPDPVLTDLFLRIEIYQIESFRKCNHRFKSLSEQNVVWEEVARQINLDPNHLRSSFEQRLPSNVLRLCAIRYIVRWCLRDSIRVEKKPLSITSARIRILEGEVTAKDVCLIKGWWWKQRKNFAANGKKFNIKVPGFTTKEELFSSRDYFVLQRVLAFRIQQNPRNFGQITSVDQLGERKEQVIGWVERHRNRIEALVEINLKFERLFQLPPILDVAHRLTRLHLSGNYLRSIPIAVERMTGLEELNLDWNLIMECPVDFTRLTNLRTLNLSNNFLFHVPRSICGLPSLTRCDLSRNIISRIPEELLSGTRLTWLNVSHNIITSIPSDAGAYSRLEFLDISSNKLAHKPQIAASNLLLTLIDCRNPFNSSSPPQWSGRFRFQVSRRSRV